MFELVIVWSNGERQVFGGYKTREAAEAAGDGYREAFGEQVAWAGTRPAYIPGEYNGYI